MSTPDNSKNQSRRWSRRFAKWTNSRTGTAITVISLIAVLPILLVGPLANQGFWEPWESRTIQTLDVPSTDDPTGESKEESKTYDNQTWLKARIISLFADSTTFESPLQVGEAEWAARAPIALATLVFILALFAWLKVRFDTWSACLGSLIVGLTPTVVFGSQFAGSDLFYLIISSGAALCAYGFMLTPRTRRQYLYGIGFGILLAGSLLEYRLMGMLYPLFIITGFGIWQRIESRSNSKLHAYLDYAVTGAVAVGLVALGLMYMNPGGTTVDIFMGSSEQWLFPAVLGGALILSIWLGRSANAIQSWVSWPGLASAGVCGAVAWSMAPDVPAHRDFFAYWTFAPSSELPTKLSHFAFWIRRAGFGLLPWSAFIPLGAGYLVYQTQRSDSTDRRQVCAYLLWWTMVAAVLTPIIGYFKPIAFLGIVPLSVGIGLSLTDTSFWSTVRQHSLLPKAIGVAVVAGLMIFFKDLQRFPARLLESFLPVTKNLELPDAFELGASLKVLKYTLIALTVAFFFRPISWLLLRLEYLKKAPGRILAWFKEPTFSWPSVSANPSESDPAAEIKRRKSEIKVDRGFMHSFAGVLESNTTWSLLVGIAGISTAAIFSFEYAPKLNQHYSQRSVYEAYQRLESEKGELFTYNLDEYSDSIYLQDLESLDNLNAFIDKFSNDKPVYLIMPREELPSLNYSVRREHDRNIPVVFDNEGDLILVTNRPTEQNQSFIAEATAQNPEPTFPLWYAQSGEMTRASFEDHLDLIGYDINRTINLNDSFPTFAWGETIELTTYYRVEKRLSRDYQIFLHIDHGGNRIHGDHEPVGGDLPTRYWVPGDVVKDHYEIDVPVYSTEGIYTIYMGFYKGSERLKVLPGQAHDGENRLILGKLRVIPSYL